MEPPPFTPFGGGEIPDAGAENARIVVLPLPYEQSVSYGAGADTGPYYLLAASEQMERLDEETGFDLGALSLHTLEPLSPSDDPETAVRQMETAAGKILAKRQRLLCLGGDHAIAIGPIRAAAEIYPDMGVLQIDAHLDLRDTWNGSRYNHACVMRRVTADMGLPVAQVGMRALAPEESDFIRQQNLRPYFAHRILEDPDAHSPDACWIEAVLDSLPETVYLTLDLDGLDPSVIPGTGTPEPGGLTYRQVAHLIRRLGRTKKVIGADICELAKIPGSQVSEYAAARLAGKIMVYCWAGK